MRRILVMILLLLLLLSGCAKDNGHMDEVIDLRNRLNNAESVNFCCRITADYGESLCAFEEECLFRSDGQLEWRITAPETISGLTGSIVNEKGQFEFDDEVLVFELLADGQISPVGAPWILLKAIRGGYIHSCGGDAELIKAQIDDSYLNAQFSVDVWFREDETPILGEIIWQGRRIMSIEISEFVIM